MTINIGQHWSLKTTNYLQKLNKFAVILLLREKKNNVSLVNIGKHWSKQCSLSSKHWSSKNTNYKLIFDDIKAT